MKEKLKYPFYVMTHPLDGFYEVRHRDKGSVLVSLLIIFLFAISYSFNRLYASFVVNAVNPRSVDLVWEMVSVFVLVIVFGVANWSVTCLMEGEGRFKDIITTLGYSMLPMVLMFIPATLFSQVLASNEDAFYFIIYYGSIIWFIMLAIIGIMTIHNFTFGKTFITLICTVVALIVIIFLILLISTLLRQVQDFFGSIYDEIMFRL